MTEQETLLRDALVVVTGARNTGKTIFAITAARPSQMSRMFYHDSERSSNRAIQELEAQGLAPGYYGSLEARFSGLPVEDDLLSRIKKGKLPWVTEAERSSLEGYYLYVLNDLEQNLTRGKYLFYVHDTIEKLEAGMAAWVEGHKKQAGWTQKAYGKLWTEGVYPLYAQLIEAIFQRGVRTVIFCSHLKTPWHGNRPVTGKVVPSGKTLLWFRTSLFLWLKQEPRNADGAPAGLVLKERLVSLQATDDDDWNPRRMLPRRIPHCAWSDIRRYLKDGCDLASPPEDEVLSREESELISEFMSNEQMKLMQLEVQKEILELQTQVPDLLRTTEEKLEIPGVTGQVKVESSVTAMTLLQEGKSPGEVSRKLGISLPLVLQAKKVMEVNN